MERKTGLGKTGRLITLSGESTTNSSSENDTQDSEDTITRDNSETEQAVLNLQNLPCMVTPQREEGNKPLRTSTPTTQHQMEQIHRFQRSWSDRDSPPETRNPQEAKKAKTLLGKIDESEKSEEIIEMLKNMATRSRASEEKHEKKLIQISQQIQDLNNSIDKKINAAVVTAMNKHMPKLEGIIKEQVIIAREELESQTATLVQKELTDFKFDLKEANKRQSNVLLHNEKESKQKDPALIKMEERECIYTYLRQIGLNPNVVGGSRKSQVDIGILHHDRIGQPGEQDKPRPILITLGTIAEADTVAKAAWQTTPRGTRCKIARDYTKREREQHKKLKQELQVRTEQGETDLIIKNGAIVKKRPFRNQPRQPNQGPEPQQ
jgi:hypothetical protein